MSRDRTRMDATADALASPEGLQPHEITVRLLVDREVRKLIGRSVAFSLAAKNRDRPDADGRYTPEWYMAHDVATGIHEGLYGVLCEVLSCEEIDEHGHRCIGSILHESNHWDGNGCNWAAASSVKSGEPQ